MSARHDDQLFRRVVDGELLTRDDERHLASCADCQRAVLDARRLDRRLREASASLAQEALPAEMLDAPTLSRPVTRSAFIMRPAFVATAAVVAAIVVGVALTDAPARFIDGPAASVSASATIARTPAVSPAPTPIPASDPNVVGPGERCADGDAGYSVELPAGASANRRWSSTPACQTIGLASPTGPSIDWRILLTVTPDRPTFDAADVELQEEITLPRDVTAERLVVVRPATEAVVGEELVIYLVPLLAPESGGRGGWLSAQTDAGSDEWVTVLDRLMSTLELHPTLTPDPEALAAAEELFHDRDVCVDDERGLGVTFPDAWWRNTAIDDLPACSYFAPGYFEISEPGAVPDAVEITVGITEGDSTTMGEVLGFETLTLLQRPATRREIAGPDGPIYQYVVYLGGTDVGGPNLVATTHAGASDDHQLAKAILDEMMGRITMSAPPPGASSTNPPIQAEPISTTDTDGDFRLELVVEQDRYRAGQPIVADAILTYLGPEAELTLRGSGTGLIGFGIGQVDGPIHVNPVFTTDCAPHQISRDAPLWVEFAKSGSLSNDDPNYAFYTGYLADGLLRLPPGRWRITAGAGFTAGGDDCGAGDAVSLTTTVEILVEP
jgi:hypothetical protein